MPIGEIDTSSVVDGILSTGKSLFVPRVLRSDPGRMQLLKVYGHEDLLTLDTGLWGIREPNPQRNGQDRVDALNATSPVLDLVLLPGVAFDRSFGRLGHGKGYYDRAIQTLEQRGQRPLLVALAARDQLLDAGSVPMGEYDRKVDFIVTADEIIGPANLPL